MFVFLLNRQLALGQRILSHATSPKHRRIMLTSDRDFSISEKQQQTREKIVFRDQEIGKSIPSNVFFMAAVICYVDDLADRVQVMAQPPKFRRVKQSAKEKQDDQSGSDFPSPMFTGAFTPEAVEFSDNNFPASIFSGPLPPEPAEEPR